MFAGMEMNKERVFCYKLLEIVGSVSAGLFNPWRIVKFI